MMAVTFDTLAFTKRLKASGFTEQQAEAQAEALAAAFHQVEESRQDALATKRDVAEVNQRIHELELRLAETKADLVKWLFGVAAGQAAFIIAVLKLFPGR